MKCRYCGYNNNNGPPVRIVCISCAEPFVPREELSPRGNYPLGRTTLDKRARDTRWCYDPIAQAAISGRIHAQKETEFESAG